MHFEFSASFEMRYRILSYIQESVFRQNFFFTLIVNKGKKKAAPSSLLLKLKSNWTVSLNDATVNVQRTSTYVHDHTAYVKGKRLELQSCFQSTFLKRLKRLKSLWWHLLPQFIALGSMKFCAWKTNFKKQSFKITLHTCNWTRAVSSEKNCALSPVSECT